MNTYNICTLDRRFLKYDKIKSDKTLPLDMLIQANNEWLGTIVSAKHVNNLLNKKVSYINRRSK